MIKKRKLPLALAATAAAAALALSACGTTGDPTTTPTTGASGAACEATIAYVGPLTGDYANLGLNMVRGAKLALEKYNAASPKCKVTLTENDSQGDPEKATPIASQIVNDSKVVGVIGPTFSGETDATGDTFAEAPLVTVTPSATRIDLSTNGWDTFHRLLGNDDVQGAAVVRHLKDVSAQKIFVIDDASAYGKGLAEVIKTGMGSAIVDTDGVQQKQTDFGPSVTKVKASGADYLFFAGYYPEAGLLAKQLKAGGWTGKFVSGDGSKDIGFVEAAGAEAADGAILTCPCAPATDDFATEYKTSSGEEPGTYSTEGFDAMNIFLQGLDAGKLTRADLLAWVNAYDADGITKRIKFDEKGEVLDAKVFWYVVEGGKVSGGTLIE